MRLTVIIIQYFIIILCIGGLFGYSQLLTDPYIVPKCHSIGYGAILFYQDITG